MFTTHIVITCIEYRVVPKFVRDKVWTLPDLSEISSLYIFNNSKIFFILLSYCYISKIKTDMPSHVIINKELPVSQQLYLGIFQSISWQANNSEHDNCQFGIWLRKKGLVNTLVLGCHSINDYEKWFWNTSLLATNFKFYPQPQLIPYAYIYMLHI